MTVVKRTGGFGTRLSEEASGDACALTLDQVDHDRARAVA